MKALYCVVTCCDHGVLWMMVKYTHRYIQQTHIFFVHSYVTVSVLSLSGWQTIEIGSMQTKQYFIFISTSRKAANLLVSSPRPSLVIASHSHLLYVILVLHLILILISGNRFPWYVTASSYKLFVTITVFAGIFLLKSPKLLPQHLVLVGLNTATA